jgi:hypothetical protein
MAAVIGAFLLLTLMYSAFRSVSRYIGHGQSTNPVLRAWDDMDRLDDPTAVDVDLVRQHGRVGTSDRAPRPDHSYPDSDLRQPSEAEIREAALARELLNGQLEPSIYQRLMSEVAHEPRRWPSGQTGGPTAPHRPGRTHRGAVARRHNNGR